MADANELSRLGGLPELPVAEFPDDDEEPERGQHWKTRFLTQWASGCPFIWLDDEVTDANLRWLQSPCLGRLCRTASTRSSA